MHLFGFIIRNFSERYCPSQWHSNTQNHSCLMEGLNIQRLVHRICWISAQGVEGLLYRRYRKLCTECICTGLVQNKMEKKRQRKSTYLLTYSMEQSPS